VTARPSDGHPTQHTQLGTPLLHNVLILHLKNVYVQTKSQWQAGQECLSLGTQCTYMHAHTQMGKQPPNTMPLFPEA